MTDLRYEVTGSGPAVCLLHSGVTDSRAWDGQVARLAPSYTVVRYDIRGFGGSPLRSGPLSHLEDLRELLDELAVEATTLVGNSFGGRIALEFALEHPARVTKLVLVAAALRDYGWSDEMRRFAEAEDEAMERGDVDAAVDLNLEMWALPHVREVVRPMARRALEVQQAAYESSTRLPSAGSASCACRPSSSSATATSHSSGIWPSSSRMRSRAPAWRSSRVPGICRASSVGTTSIAYCSSS